MFFRGKGTVKAKEENSYHPDVVVLFQNKAWADLPTLVDWVDQCLKPWKEANLMEGESFLLFQDHLGCQKKTKYVKAVKALG
eukprot:4987227-Heterocapsa_arctica.AAC.1